MKKTCGKLTIASMFLCAICTRAQAADPMQSITLNVPVDISWPQSDVTQAFVQGPPFLKCNLTYSDAPNDPTGMQWTVLAMTADNQYMATAAQPLMVDASGHYSGTVTLNFSVPVSSFNASKNHAYWCYLASSNKKNAQLRDYANARGLKIDIDHANAWKRLNN